MTTLQRRPLTAALRARAREAKREIELRRLRRRLAAPKLLGAFAEVHPAARFVEVGSNDGDQHDHLQRFIRTTAWRGVMVEPVPYIFERLRRNYDGLERVALENAAIGLHDGSAPFWFLVDASEEERRGLPDWYDGIGSFSKESVLGHAVHIPDIEDGLVCRDVPVLTLASLCRKHGLDAIDLLVVDTEGYDAEIVRSVDLDTIRPSLIVYEHFHLPSDERAACAERLREHGYRTMEEGFDTFCLDTGADARLQRVWDTLTPAVRGVSVEDERR